MHRDPSIIKLYKGFASEKVTYIFGHVLRSVSKQRENLTSNPFKNALEMYRRYKVSPAKYATVVVTTEDGRFWETNADKKGFFMLKIEEPGKPTNVKVHLKENPEISCDAYIEKLTPELIIVSDIDDTILISHATNLFKKIYVLLTKNHESRKAFEGIRSFYNQLSKSEPTAFFYVSSSEWNLYDFLRDFVEFNQLPDGVFLLQNIKSGIKDLFKSGGGSHDHKREKIEMIMESFPHSEFILVGDSGQKDPYLYQQIAIQKPEKIRSIHIRDVRSSKRSKVMAIADQLAKSNIKMEIFSDS